MGINDIFTNTLNSIYIIYQNTLSYINLVMSKNYGVWAGFILGFILVIPIILLVLKKDRIINNMTAMLIKNIKIVLIIIFISKLFNVLNKDVTNVINVLFNTYRPLIYLVVVFLFLIELVVFNKSAYLIIKTYLRNFLYVNYVVLFISTPYSIEQLVLSCLLIVLSIEIISCLEIFKLKNNKEKTLYKSRKKQIEDLNSSLMIHKDDNYAIAINGKWGSGKTEFLKYYMDKYPDDYYIYIQPMVTDTIDSLIKQFKDQLIKIMIDNGI